MAEDSVSTDVSPFPALHDVALADTRDALHAYARVMGGWRTSCRSRRKHWWQGSLRPSLRGLTTGVLHAGPGFELELNLIESQLHARTASGDELVEALRGRRLNLGRVGERLKHHGSSRSRQRSVRGSDREGTGSGYRWCACPYSTANCRAASLL